LGPKSAQQYLINLYVSRLDIFSDVLK